MSLCKKSLWLVVCVGFLIINFGGCVQAPSSRMPAILGLSVDKKMTSSSILKQWPNHQTFGLITLSDATGPQAAPAISADMLSRLSQRSQLYLGKHCATPVIKVIPNSGIQISQGLSSLLKAGRAHGAESLIFALFSSTEITEPATFGEARMMTQMQGTTTHNSALVELGLIDVEQGVVTVQANGEAAESLDRLDAPIGDSPPTFDEALDILRANAGQQALDKALTHFTRGCRAV